jgi:hypothetical protein
LLGSGSALPTEGVKDFPLLSVSDDPSRPSTIARDSGDHTIILRCQRGHLAIAGQGDNGETRNCEMKQTGYTITRDAVDDLVGHRGWGRARG